jgi:hypothetical protein
VNVVAKQPIFKLVLRQAAIMVAINGLEPSTELRHPSKSEQNHQARVTAHGMLGLLLAQATIAVVVCGSKDRHSMLNQQQASWNG